MTPRIARFQWDVANLAHIARHSVTSVEVEEAFLDVFARTEGSLRRNGELRFRMLGETREGRVLVVVFSIRQGQIRTVTAHSAKGKLLAQYNAGRLR